MLCFRNARGKWKKFWQESICLKIQLHGKGELELTSSWFLKGKNIISTTSFLLSHKLIQLLKQLKNSNKTLKTTLRAQKRLVSFSLLKWMLNELHTLSVIRIIESKSGLGWKAQSSSSSIPSVERDTFN